MQVAGVARRVASRGMAMIYSLSPVLLLKPTMNNILTPPHHPNPNPTSICNLSLSSPKPQQPFLTSVRTFTNRGPTFVMASSSSSSGSSPNHHEALNAAFSGNLNLLIKLGKELDYGEGVAKGLMKIKDDELRNALHYAAAGGATHVCKYLIEQLNFNVNVKDVSRFTPLHTAVLEDHYLTIAYLLDHGAHLNAPGDGGLTALHYAAEKGRKNLLRLLISKGAEVDAQSPKGTPLQYAAKNGMKDSVGILLENGANPNSVSYDMFTPLIVSIIANSVDCVRLLLKFGADPNISSCGQTTLTSAASLGETEIINCLLEAGADANATNSFGLTPVEIAASLGNLVDVRALYPVTTRIPSIPDWSVSGILDYTNSDEVMNQVMLKSEQKFLEAKAKGEEAIEKKDYMNAIHWYTEAFSLKPDDAEVHANRSLCWAHLKEGHYALQDAVSAIRLREDWPKARYRAGVALTVLQDYRMAACAFAGAWELDTRNREIQQALIKTLADWKAVAADDEECEVYLTFPLLGRCTVRLVIGPPSYLSIVPQKTQRLLNEMNR